MNELERVIGIIGELRQKCPWDREQTIESLKLMTVEECYELVDAVNNGDYDNLKEELGDLLLHIVFYSVIAQEKGLFTLEDVAHDLAEKLIFRHPHVYGELSVKRSGEVEQNWEKLKRIEKKGKRDGVLSGVTEALPAVMKAYKIQKKAAKVGFDWPEPEPVWAKVEEETEEVREAVASNDRDAIEAEFGDLLFAVINAARLYKVDPEQALERTNRKFISRFGAMERMAKANGTAIDELTLEEMETLWGRAKKEE